MEYKVTVRLVEEYEGYVEATDKAHAETLAIKMFNNGELEIKVDSFDVDIEPAEGE